MNLRSLLALDARLSDRLRVAEQPGALRTFSAFCAHSGDSWFWGAGLVLMWFLAAGAWKPWAIIQLAGISVLAALVMLTKFTIRRRRPAGSWGTIYRTADPHSFPSGHAARSFFLAIVASGLGPAWLALILWVWAPLVALARIVMGLHYVSDVLAGVVVGVVTGAIWLQLSPVLLGWIFARLNMSPW